MPYIIYQSGPLFGEADRQFHKALSARLRDAGHEVIWPGDLFDVRQLREIGPYASNLIFKGCCNAMAGCTCVVALLDGAQVDDGTSWELGYAYAKGIPIYGLRTDLRIAGDAQDNYVNSMIQGCLTEHARNVDDLVRMLA